LMPIAILPVAATGAMTASCFLHRTPPTAGRKTSRR
jgi:hypothetical protein